MIKSKLSPGILNVLSDLKKEVALKQAVVDELDVLVKKDKLVEELDETNKAIERKIDSNAEYLAKLKKSIKDTEGREVKAIKNEEARVETARINAGNDIINIKKEVNDKKQWGAEKMAQVDEAIKGTETDTKRKAKELNADIVSIEKKHVAVKNAYEETRKLANV